MKAQRSTVLFTEEELIADWIVTYPEDARSPNLRQMAIAGYVQMKDGLFYWSSYGRETTWTVS